MSVESSIQTNVYGLMYLMGRYAAQPAAWIALVIVNQLETLAEKRGGRLSEAEQTFFLGQLATWRSRLATHVNDSTYPDPALPKLVRLARQV